MIVVGIPKEVVPGERRVAMVPAVVPSLAKAGLEVRIQPGAGLEAGYPDEAYVEKGAKIAGSREEVFAADVVFQIRTGGAAGSAADSDLALIKRGGVVIGMADPLGCPESARKIAETGATFFALELVPRITRAQSMDVLSSMATIAGYRAVLLAATALPKMFPMMMTAAGTIAPARVFIVGAGVAGLQAIASSKRLGAVVSAYDVRPVVKEQVESLGGKFLEIQLNTTAAEDKGGYAKQLDDEAIRKQQELMLQAVADSDVVITTAAVPGKKAPILVTAKMVQHMKPGSVVVDLAAERGGNCELTRPGETIVTGGVTILGPANLPAEIPYHASQMYAKNIATFLLNMVKDGQLNLDMEDEIIRETLVARDGKIVNPRVAAILGIEIAPPATGAGQV